MSTRINVNIGDGGLLDRNAQQQAAARQANQQRASAEKAAAEGQRQLEQERISQGRDPATGERLPSAGSSSRIQRIDQEPAANRRQQALDVLLVPEFPYASYGGTFTGIRGRTKSGTVVFSRNLFDFTPQDFGTVPTLIYGDALDFLGSGGPSGSAALKAPSPPSPFIRIVDWQPIPGDFPSPTPGTQQYELTNQAVLQSVRFALTRTPYDSVSRNVFTTPPAQDTPPPPSGELLLLDGNIAPALPKKKLAELSGTTHEILVNLTSGAPAQGGRMLNPSTSVGIGTATGRNAVVTLNAEGLSIRLTATEFVTSVAPDGPLGYLVWNPPYVISSGVPEGFRRVFEVGISSVWALNIAVQDFFLSVSDSTLVQPGFMYFGGAGSDPLITSEQATQWVHCALVRTVNPSTGNREWSVYWGGKRLVTGVINPVWDTTFGQRPIAAGIDVRVGISRSIALDYALPSIHGYRFTPRALYTGDTFIPPTQITRFA
jgi:hypothetical protein